MMAKYQQSFNSVEFINMSTFSYSFNLSVSMRIIKSIGKEFSNH